jgi:hypothetical protein
MADDKIWFNTKYEPSITNKIVKTLIAIIHLETERYKRKKLKLLPKNVWKYSPSIKFVWGIDSKEKKAPSIFESFANLPNLENYMTSDWTPCRQKDLHVHELHVPTEDEGAWWFYMDV